VASARRFFLAPLDAGLIDSSLRLLEALSAACGTVAPLAFLIRAIDSQQPSDLAWGRRIRAEHKASNHRTAWGEPMQTGTRDHRTAAAGDLAHGPSHRARFVGSRAGDLRRLLILAMILVPPAVLAEDPRNRDFDFESGAWTVQASRLVAPLSGADEWVEYTGTSVVRALWHGRANIGELLLEGPAGRIEGMSLRVFDPGTAQWRIHWTDAQDGRVGEAMVGGFDEGQGLFYHTAEFQGQPVRVRVVFTDITPSSFRLEQAFSIDDGESWEPNWLATFKRDTAARDMDTAHGIARGSGRRSTRPGMHAMRSGLRPCSTMRPA